MICPHLPGLPERHQKHGLRPDRLRAGPAVRAPETQMKLDGLGLVSYANRPKCLLIAYLPQPSIPEAGFPEVRCKARTEGVPIISHDLLGKGFAAWA